MAVRPRPEAARRAGRLAGAGRAARVALAHLVRIRLERAGLGCGWATAGPGAHHRLLGFVRRFTWPSSDDQTRGVVPDSGEISADAAIGSNGSGGPGTDGARLPDGRPAGALPPGSGEMLELDAAADPVDRDR